MPKTARTSSRSCGEWIWTGCGWASTGPGPGEGDRGGANPAGLEAREVLRDREPGEGTTITGDGLSTGPPNPHPNPCVKPIRWFLPLIRSRSSATRMLSSRPSCRPSSTVRGSGRAPRSASAFSLHSERASYLVVSSTRWTGGTTRRSSSLNARSRISSHCQRCARRRISVHVSALASYMEYFLASRSRMIRESVDRRRYKIAMFLRIVKDPEKVRKLLTCHLWQGNGVLVRCAFSQSTRRGW